MSTRPKTAELKFFVPAASGSDFSLTAPDAAGINESAAPELYYTNSPLI